MSRIARIAELQRGSAQQARMTFTGSNTPWLIGIFAAITLIQFLQWMIGTYP